jgi:orotate phosphoribosyltransferase
MLDEFRRCGLLDDAGAASFCRPGHFRYESGDHGDLWLDLALLYANPRGIERAADHLAGKLRRHHLDLVCGPLLGGALLGPWVARALDVAFVYAEPLAGERSKAPMYAIPHALLATLPDRRVAIVDDVINLGAATRGCVPAVESGGGRVAVVAALAFRVPGTLDEWARRGIAVENLAQARWNTWPSNDCPLCRADAPLEVSAGSG